MEIQKKVIGVLTSGGDAPGMNAAIRAVVRAGIEKGHRVVGVRRGYQGLLNKDVEEMSLRSVCDIIQRGGTMLFTARSPEFRTEAGVDKAVAHCHELGLDGLVVIGGDGSFRGARDLSNKGIPCIGLPGTIDNDIASTEYTIGFDTAVNTVVENIDRLRDTSQSHDRCSVVEVMGRRAGHIALHAGISCGAISILIPEREFNIDVDVIDRMRATLKTGKQHFIVIVAEGVGDSKRICEYIEEKTGIESRLTVLGHIQRGGTPTAMERVHASVMGYRAVELLEQGKGNRVVGIQNNRTVDYDINEALEMTKDIDQYLYKVAYEISI